MNARRASLIALVTFSLAGMPGLAEPGPRPTAATVTSFAASMCPCGCGSAVNKCPMKQCSRMVNEVMFRTAPDSPWQFYGRYRGLGEAQRVAAGLRNRGLEVLVTRKVTSQ